VVTKSGGSVTFPKSDGFRPFLFPIKLRLWPFLAGKERRGIKARGKEEGRHEKELGTVGPGLTMFGKDRRQCLGVNN